MKNKHTKSQQQVAKKHNETFEYKVNKSMKNSRAEITFKSEV